jgi:WD domain, G-beta repeat
MKSLLASSLALLIAPAVSAAPPAPVTALAYHPDGKLLAAGTYQDIILIDPAKGEVLGKLPGQTQRVTALAFSKDGKRLAVASGEPSKAGEIRLYAIPPQGLPAQPEHTWTAHKDSIYTLAFSPDGILLASAGYDRIIKLWNPTDAKLVRELKDHSDTIYAVAFHPDGKLLASGSADRAVKVWDATTGRRLYTLADPTDWVYTLAWSPDRQHLAAAGVDKSIRVWETTTEGGKLVQSVFAHTAPVTRLAYSSDGKILVSASQRTSLKSWDTARMTEKLALPAQPETVLSLALRPDDKQLAVGRYDGACVLLDAATGKPIFEPLPEKPKPPTLSKITPTFGQRGTTVRIVCEGQNLRDVTEMMVNAPALKPRVLAEEKSANRVHIEIAIPAEAPAGPVQLGLKSPAGASGNVPFMVDRFPVINERSLANLPSTGQPIDLPATLAGTIDRAGQADHFRFHAKEGQQIGVQVFTIAAGSKLEAVLEVTDESGQVVVESSNGLLGFVAPKDSTYMLGIHDKEYRGGTGMSYRISAGDVPIVNAVFPLGVRRGESAKVTVTGVNLGRTASPVVEVKVPADAAPGSRVPVPLPAVKGEKPLGELSVVVGEFPEQNAVGGAMPVLDVPGTVNGILRQPGETHVVEFKARKGEQLLIETHARRIGAPLDTAIDVLDQANKPVMRATLRCVARTFSVFRDHDSSQGGIRLETWNELAINDYLYVDGELMRIHELPKNPDDDCQFYTAGGQRLGFLDTTPKFHSQGVPMYKVEIHPPGTSFPPNGMPVFELPYRNDDGGPGYGKDSRVFFDPPADGIYRVRISDARGMGGDNCGYRLTVRRPRPEFSVSFSPTAPAIWKGGAVPVGVTITRIDGYDGPVQIALQNLPPGFDAPTTTVEGGQTTTTFAVYARPDAASPPKTTTSVKLVARGRIGGNEIVHETTGGLPSVIEPGDIVATTSVSEVSVRPGQEARLLVRVERRNGFKGRIPLEVRGLPHGVRVLDIGLNGILITEQDSAREVAIYADPWVKPTEHPFVVLAKREGKNSEHAAKSVLLKITK